jgi:hypothetical protein
MSSEKPIPGQDPRMWGGEVITHGPPTSIDWCTLRQAQEARDNPPEDKDVRIRQAAEGLIIIKGLTQTEAQQLLDVRALLQGQ